jgi:hypothetical protein
MVNNLAQLPLASYPYPTYQHIGSPSSEVAIGMISVGDRVSDDDEPSHTGVNLLSDVISFLDNQYLSFRNNWRSVTSLHRMQAVYVENQILNMLGIRGLTLDNLSTETLPDASNLAQATLSARQYENIFENVGSFRIRTRSLPRRHEHKPRARGAARRTGPGRLQLPIPAASQAVGVMHRDHAQGLCTGNYDREL